MERVMARCWPGGSGALAGVSAGRNRSSLAERLIQASHPSAAVRIEYGIPNETDGRAICGIDSRIASKKTKSRIRYVKRPDSIAEPENEFDESNPGITMSHEGPVEGDRSEGQGAEEDRSEEDLQKEYKMTRVCDRLIEVFMIEKTTPAQWRKLIAFSREWQNIRPHFFKRCNTNASLEEDPKRKGDLFKLARKLKEVDEDMLRHNELLGQIEKKELELDSIVARRRKDFTVDFFEHLETLCDANFNDLDRRDEIVKTAKKCLSAVEAYDAAQVDAEALSKAQLKFDDILSSPSLEDAVNKIDRLAQRQQLDSTLMLLVTKAYAAAKESTMMKEEVKDILFHLYKVTMGNMQRLVQKEIRIIRHLLSIQDPQERFAVLTEAFCPGNELEGMNEDLLYTTPEQLLVWINIVLDAYRTNRQGTLIKEAQKLMKPEIISRVEELKKIVEGQFM